MNIFIMLLAFLFMAGYYFLDSPAQRVARQELESAVTRTDLRSIAECAAAAHTAAIRNFAFTDVCGRQYNISSESVCLNERLAVTKCEIVRQKKPAYSFIITSTEPINHDDYNRMLELLEEYYPHADSFGIFMDDVILGGGSHGKRAVPQGISKSLKLDAGQLVYMTQFEIPDAETDYVSPAEAAINCPAGTVKIYRFGRWQCAQRNEKTSCGGDKIWDSDLMECVPDETRRPLCASRQTAVMVDDIWECIDPFQERNCPAGMVARLNYNTLEWECIEDPSDVQNAKKCAPPRHAVYGAIGSTLRIPASACTDCEEMITNSETCATSCVPNPSKLSDPKCYPGRLAECGGSSRAFYFGFPGAGYAANVSAVSGYQIPFDTAHSQNRKFNCLDCGAGKINAARSLPPYIAVCE
jgi:hypothetical protein